MIKFSDFVRNNITEMGISEIEVQEVINSPDVKEEFTHFELKLNLYMKTLQINSERVDVLAISGITRTQDELVEYVFRVKNNSIKDNNISSPSQLLDLLIEKTGATVRIGSEVSRLHKRVAVPIPSNTPELQSTDLTVFNKAWCVSFGRTRILGATKIFEGALVFVIDTIKYFQWLKT